MKFVVSDKNKKDIFVSIFLVLKNCTSIISCIFEEELLHIQGMDKSHICLFDIKLKKTWFDEYIVPEKKILSFDSNIFYSIISTKSESQSIIFKMETDNEDTLFIDFISNEEKKNSELKEKKTKKKSETKQFKKSFKLPLTENEYEELNIPSTEYDAEFTLYSNQINDIFTQLNHFGNYIIIKCSEENIYLTTNGVTGEMRVQIPIDDVSSYSIVEGEEIILTYSLIYLNKMCITNKLSEEIEFSLSNESPMKIVYSLGEDSSIAFYMAPKVSE